MTDAIGIHGMLYTICTYIYFDFTYIVRNLQLDPPARSVCPTFERYGLDGLFCCSVLRCWWAFSGWFVLCGAYCFMQCVTRNAQQCIH